VEDLKPLVEKAQAGDVKAYGEIVGRLQDMVYGYAFSLLGDFHLAQDAAQEAFIQAYRDLNMLRKPLAFPSWLRRIVFKYCDRTLRQRRPRTGSLDAATSEPVSNEPGPMETAEKRELKYRVLAAIRNLPQDQRMVTTLYYINGYSVNDIANFLETPAGTVKRRLYDSRKKLKERMMEMVAEELKASKPGPDFRALIEKAAVLQSQKKYHEALAVHQQAVSVASHDGQISVGAETYPRFMGSYMKEGAGLQFAEGILTGVPADPSPEQMLKTIEQLILAGWGFVGGEKPERAAEQAERVLEYAETIKGRPWYRFYRSGALSLLYRAAVLQGNEAEVARRLDDVHANLAAYERDLAAACPGLNRSTDTDDKEKRAWFDGVGNAYHNLAVNVPRSRGDNVEALRLMRRATELRDLWVTYSILSAWALSVEGDRQASLGYLKRAAESDGGKYLKALRRNFDEYEDFAPVREDRDFLAVLAE